MKMTIMKMPMKNRAMNTATGFVLAATAFLSPALTAKADTYQWTRTGQGGSFEDVANWQGGTSPANDPAAEINLASVEDTGTDIGYATLLGQGMGRYVRQALTLPNSCFTFTSVTSNMPNQSLVVSAAAATVCVTDPNRFTGLWRMDAKNEPSFAFSNDGTTRPTLQYLQNGLRTVVNAESATTKAAVGSLVSGGLFMKKGAGDLKLVNPNDLESTCGLTEGSLTLGRAEVAVPTEPVAGAVCHLDASDSSTLTTDADGKVTGWTDLANADRTFAPITEVTAYGTPKRVTVGGKTLVDFGAQAKYDAKSSAKTELSSAAQQAELGAAAMLQAGAGKSVPAVKELFIVAEVTTDSKTPVTLVGGNWQFGWSLGTDDASECFASGTMVDPGVAAGDWLVNGTARKSYSRPEKGRLLVYSVKGCFPRPFSSLAGYFRGDDTGIFGGLRIGEVLAYDKELTDDERLANHRYLMDKWQTGSARTVWDLGRVALKGTETSVNVEAGETAHVRRVFGSDDWAGHAADQYPLNKTGDGELVVEEVYPSTLPIHVKGGSIAFTSTIDRDITDDQPAAGAHLHLDATKADTLVSNDAGGISQWKDCNGGTLAMTLIDGRDAPTVANVTINDQQTQVLDFGDTYKNGGAALYLTDGEKAVSPLFYEVFTVLKRQDQANDSQIFSTKSDAWYFVGNASAIFQKQHAAPAVQGADYAVNGRFVWGDIGINAGEIAGFSVYSASFAAEPIPVNALANWIDNGGGCQIAEHICYTRRLTDAERRQTTAYLMKKWGRGAHPDAAVSTVGPIDFTAGVTPVVGTDSPRMVASITSADADATLVKTGAGALTVGSLANIAAVKVEGGALVVTGEQNLRLDALTIPETQFAEGAAPLVKVNGTLSFAENGQLDVTVAEGPVVSGEWKVAEATTIDGATAGHLVSWTVTARTTAGKKARGAFELVVKSDGVYVRRWRKGALFIIR